MNKIFSLKNIATDLFIYSGIILSTFLWLGPERYKETDVSLIKAPSKTLEQKINKEIDYDSMSLEEVIKYIKTPEQAQHYLNNLDVPKAPEREEKSVKDKESFFPFSEKSKTFRDVHYSGTANCLGHSIAAAALLKDNGYSPVIMFLESEGFSENHAVYIYKKNNKYGVLGTSSLKPEFDTISEIKEELRERYPENKPRKYWLSDLDKSFPDEEWIYGSKNMQPNPRDKLKIFFNSKE